MMRDKKVARVDGGRGLLFAEKFVVAVFDVLIRLDVALEETFGIGCNPRFFGGYLLYFFKIVRAVDFPALQEADVDSGCGAAERTTHTGEAVVVETDAAGGITIDIAGGAGVDAAVAVDALLGVDFVEERVDGTGDIHGSGNNAAYDVGPKRGTLDVGDMVGDFVDEGAEELFVFLEHLFHKLFVETEMDVVGHQKVILVVGMDTAAAEFAKHIF